MRAAIYEKTGPARDVLRRVRLPAPHPGPGEVRVRVACSGVNPSDVKSRAGLRSRSLPFARIVPHSDGAGTIDAVGAGVDRARVGERVWLWNAAWGRADGTAAELVCLPAAQAVRLPDNASMAAGACLGIPALTAWQAVNVDGRVAGKTVMVTGGAGAVGHYAIQIARLQGAARIVATVSGPEKAAIAEAAGADFVINYRTEDIAARVMQFTGGRGVDRIIEVDLAANVAADLATIDPEGDIVVYGSGRPEVPVPFFPAIVKNVRMRFFIVYNLSPADRAAALAGVNALVEAGALEHRIAARLPLERIAEAHELVESGSAIGNVVVDVDPVSAMA